METALRRTLPKGRFVFVSRQRSESMRAVRGKGNKTTELKFRMALVRAGISGWSIQPKLPGHPDFFFENRKLVVFIDGCFWHGCPKCGHVPNTNRSFWVLKIRKNRQRDKLNSRVLARLGYRVLRFWEHQLKSNPSLCLKRIPLSSQ